MSTDIVEAGSALGPRIHAFFDTKTSCDVDGTMAYFAPDALTYIDATLGWVFDSHAALRSVFEQYMPNWGPPARSYATRVLANDTSALVHMVDTPELFGGELRVLAAIDLEDGRIVRGSTLRHIVGGRAGGGFEWTSPSGGVAGVTAIELDTDGLIMSITSVYDSRQLTPPVKAALVAAATPVDDATPHGSDQ